jgi:hypothetical protein
MQEERTARVETADEEHLAAERLLLGFLHVTPIMDRLAASAKVAVP